MGVFSRLSDIVNSNVNVILERAEDPEKIIRLVIQEMEETLVEVRSSLARTIADKKDVARRLARLRDAQAEWRRKAEMALGKDREDLSRAALIEKSKLNDAAAALDDELAVLTEVLENGEADVLKLDAKLAEAKAKRKSLMTRHASAASRLRVRRQVHDGRVDDAFARFEQVEKRLDEAEGRVEAMDMGRPRTLAEEFDELEADAQVEEELAAMKARLDAAGKDGAARARRK